MLNRSALLVLVLLAGCRGGAGGSTIDGSGRPVAVPARAERVFPLAPNLTELVAAVAGVERLAGVAPADDFPAGIAGLPRVATYPIDAEGLVALHPDLVLGSLDVTTTADADRLTGLGLPTYLFRFAALADIPRAMRTLDTLLAVRGGATAAAEFERRVAGVRQAVAGFAAPRVLLLVGDGTGSGAGGTFYAFGRGSYASEMVRAAGGDNLTDRYDGAAATPSEEAILDMAPEVIFVLGDAAGFGARHPALLTTPAVASGRVYGLDPDLVSRPGPRVAEGVGVMARRLHPEAFAAGAA